MYSGIFWRSIVARPSNGLERKYPFRSVPFGRNGTERNGSDLKNLGTERNGNGSQNLERNGTDRNGTDIWAGYIYVLIVAYM